MKSFPYQISNLEEYHQAYQKSIKQPAQFWEEIAQNFTWKKKWDSVLEWNFKDPKIEWFKGAQLNITENCLDRHLKNFGDQAAIIWEPNNPDEPSRELTYNDLYKKVCQFSHVLKNNGVKKGDTVCIYMGMIPEQESAPFIRLYLVDSRLKVFRIDYTMLNLNSLSLAMVLFVAKKIFL
jgi:acetyl-CoA synthetase